MATHSGILAWRIPQTEEPGGLQSTGSRRVGRLHMQTHKRKRNMQLWVGVFTVPCYRERSVFPLT